jgi:transposase
MTLKDDDYRMIVLYRLKGFSIRRTARDLGRSRATVTAYYQGKKWLGQEKDGIHFRPEGSEGASNEKAEHKEKIIQFCRETITAHANDPNKQGLNKKKLHAEVEKEFGKVPYTTFCRWLRRRNMCNKREVFVHLQFDPGETMQADFCDYKLKLRGEAELVTVKLFCCVMPNSNDPFVAVLPDEQRPTLMFANQMAFEYFGGTPLFIIYDNMTQVVDEDHGKNAKINKAFQRFANHYGYEIRCANRARGNEKGSIENLCKNSRSYLWGIEPVSCLREVQDHIIMKIAEYRAEAMVKGRPASVMEMSTAERAMLNPLPRRRFTEGVQKDVTISKFRTFTYDTCEYSVPVLNPGTQIGIRVTPYDITCYHMGHIIYTHTRSVLRYKKVLVVDHYLDIYERKPRSMNNSLALKTGLLPAELDEFRSKCAEKNVGEHLVRIMLLSRDHEPKNVREAVEKANMHRNPTYELVYGILNIIENSDAGEDEGQEGQWAGQDAYDFKTDPLSIYDDLLKDDEDWETKPSESDAFEIDD